MAGKEEAAAVVARQIARYQLAGTATSVRCHTNNSKASVTSRGDGSIPHPT